MKKYLLAIGILITSTAFAQNISHYELELQYDLIINKNTKKISIDTYHRDPRYITPDCFFKVNKKDLSFKNNESYVIPKGTRINTQDTTTMVSSAALNSVHYAKLILIVPGLLPFTKTATKKLSHKYLEEFTCSYTADNGMEDLTPISDSDAAGWLQKDLSNEFNLLPIERERIILD